MEKSKDNPNGRRLSRLASFAGGRMYLTYASLLLSAVSAALSVVPYYYIWLILDEVLAAYPDLGDATGIVHNGWMAVGFTVLSVALYIAALMCSHLAAFRVAANIRKATVSHVLKLPSGSFDALGRQYGRGAEQKQ